jgi:hypothetical protein
MESGLSFGVQSTSEMIWSKSKEAGNRWRDKVATLFEDTVQCPNQKCDNFYIWLEKIAFWEVLKPKSSSSV